MGYQIVLTNFYKTAYFHSLLFAMWQKTWAKFKLSFSRASRTLNFATSLGSNFFDWIEFCESFMFISSLWMKKFSRDVFKALPKQKIDKISWNSKVLKSKMFRGNLFAECSFPSLWNFLIGKISSLKAICIKVWKNWKVWTKKKLKTVLSFKCIVTLTSFSTDLLIT